MPISPQNVQTAQGALIDYYTAYVSQAAAAASNAQNTALGIGIAAIATATPSQVPLSSTAAYSYHLRLYPSGLATNSASVPTNIGVSAFNPTSIPTGNSGIPNSVASLDFYCVPQGDGLVQRIDYVEQARQQIRPTFAGFWVDEFGLAPGKLNLQALVVIKDTPYENAATQVYKFNSLLAQSKQYWPQPNAPYQLFFYDITQGRALLITQDSVRIQMSVDSPNIATVIIEADILQDFGLATNPAQSLSTNPPKVNYGAQGQLMTYTYGGQTYTLYAPVVGQITQTANGGTIVTTNPLAPPPIP